MRTIPFNKSQDFEEKDKAIEEKLIEYTKKRYPWLKFITSRKSYSVLRFEFNIAEPDFFTPKVANEIAMRTNIVLAADKCTAFPYKDRLIINVPRDNKDTLYLGGGLEELLKEDKKPIRCYIGECDDGAPAIIDFIETPHLLIGGTTGSGKSVALNDIMLSLMFMYTPEEAQFYILDDKHALKMYEAVPHYVDGAFERADFGRIVTVLENELNVRKKIIGESGMVDIEEYNAVNAKKIPHSFVIFDEADTILKIGAETSSTRSIIEEIAAEGRAYGMHMIIASQKPEKRNIDTTIKSNIPARLALQVSNGTDSRVILDEKGAEKLTGNGDGLLKINSKTKRIQVAFASLKEYKDAIQMLKEEA